MHVVDWVAVVLSAYFAHGLYLDEWILRPNYEPAILLGLVLVAWLFSLFGLYRVWRGSPILVELRALLMAWSAVFFLLAFLATLTKTGAEFSRGWGLSWYALGLFVLVGFRVLLRLVLRTLRQHGYNQRQIILIGTESSVNQVIQNLENAPWAGLEIVGVFIDSKDGVKSLTVPCLGSIDEVGSKIGTLILDQVWIALPLNMEETVHGILHDLRHSTIDIRYVPDLFGMRLINHSVSIVAGLSVLNLSASPMVGISRFAKEAEDRGLALLILILISPLLLLIAAGVKVSSPGPAFYRQERVGWNGRSFTMLKFRSMPTDNEHEGARWGGAKEKETTRFGALLRKTSLDELPQFINVLKGEMSIVGPRPERTMFVDEFKDDIPGYMKKHMVKAGITGWAQVNGLRGDTDLNKRIELDLFYVENWTVWFDLRIILLTVLRGFTSPKAY